MSAGAPVGLSLRKNNWKLANPTGRSLSARRAIGAQNPHLRLIPDAAWEIDRTATRANLQSGVPGDRPSYCTVQESLSLGRATSSRPAWIRGGQFLATVRVHRAIATFTQRIASAAKVLNCWSPRVQLETLLYPGLDTRVLDASFPAGRKTKSCRFERATRVGTLDFS